MTDKPKKNSLTDAQKFALRDWLLGQEMNGTTYASMTDLTKAAQAAHDFPITACNMYNLQSSANVFLIQQKPKKASEFADLEARIKRLEHTVIGLGISLAELEAGKNLPGENHAD